MENTSLAVPSITCSVCADKIDQGLKSMKGINTVNVDLKSKVVEVSYDPSFVNPKDIRKKVSSLGFEVLQ